MHAFNLEAVMFLLALRSLTAASLVVSKNGQKPTCPRWCDGVKFGLCPVRRGWGGCKRVSSLSTDRDRVDDILDSLCTFVDGFVLPLEEKHAEVFEDPRRYYANDGTYSEELRKLRREVRMNSSNAGFFTMCVPEGLGGGGQGPLLHLLAWERLYHRYGAAVQLPYDTIAHWSKGPSQIFLDASPVLRNEILPTLMSGEKTMCFSLSEPDAGSDSWNLRTVAEPADGGWRINGTKQWSSNGPTADFALVFAVTDRDLVRRRQGGVTAFLVPSDSEGFRVDSTLRLFGAPGGEEAIISYNDVFVPSNYVVGEVHDGFKLALSGISLGRMFNAGRSIGVSRWAMEIASAYAKERVAFGEPIANYQAIQWMLAESAMKIYASRTMALDCANRLESGAPVRKELAIVKAFTTEAGFEIIDKCMQIFGGMGLTNELGLHHAWHQARISRIADGSAEVMRRTIAKRILDGDFDF